MCFGPIGYILGTEIEMLLVGVIPNALVLARAASTSDGCRSV